MIYNSIYTYEGQPVRNARIAEIKSPQDSLELAHAKITMKLELNVENVILWHKEMTLGIGALQFVNTKGNAMSCKWM